MKMIIKIFNIGFFSAALLLCAAFSFAEAAESWTKVADRVSGELDSAMESYRAGDDPAAKKKITDAYFNAFEASGMENKISVSISEDRKSALEGMFSDLRGAVTRGKPIADVIGMKDLLAAELKADAARLDGMGRFFLAAFFNSFLIIVREGFEAILIIGALAAYLRKTGNIEKIRTVYRGAVLAVVASVISAVVLNSVINVSGKSREAIEGVTMLTATAVLFYVSWWLLSKSEAKRWHDYIKDRVHGSLSKGSAFALGLTAFLAVYREGMETVLFYQALLSDSMAGAIVSGFLAGSIVLAGIFLMIRFLSIRIPQGPFFVITSVLLYYLAFSFAGKGVRELQEAGWISSNPIDGMTAMDFIGVYPTVEGMALQTVLLVLFIFASIWSFMSRTQGVEA